MSASTKKKIRKEQYLSERQRKEAEEQKKLKRYTVTFWIVLALCLTIVLSAVMINPVKNVVYRNTVAMTIGEHELSAVEVNYFYIDAINTYVNNYSSYISYIIDTKSPLNSASNTDKDGSSWADKFLDMAIENIKSTYQLYDMAVKAGFKLEETESKGIDTMMSNLEIYAKYYGYDSADVYLRSMYGNGANSESYRAYYEICTIADCYYTEYQDSLEFDAEALRNHEADKMWQYNSYTYAYYYFNHNTFLEGGTKGADGKTTYSDEEKAAAAEVARQMAEKIAAGEYADLDAFDKAINALMTEYMGTKDDKKEEDTTTGDKKTATQDENTEDNKTEGDKTEGDKTEDKEEEKLKYISTRKEKDLYSKLNTLFADWLRGKDADEDDKTDEEKDEDKEEVLVVRNEGDMTVIVSKSGSGENETINGYYVLRFGSVSDNTFNLKNVRHLLVAYEGGKTDSTTGQKTYTEAEKKAAKEAAEKLLAEFEKTGKTEADFEKLAKEHSDDTGSKEKGGLYEDIYPGQMVTEFEDWCYDEERKVGDYGLVQTDYGYHIMYYVGESEVNYRDFMIENDVRSETMTKWMEDLLKKAVMTLGTLKYVNRELVLSQG